MQCVLRAMETSCGKVYSVGGGGGNCFEGDKLSDAVPYLYSC